MKVAELKDILASLPQDAEVLLFGTFENEPEFDVLLNGDSEVWLMDTGVGNDG